MWVNFDAEIKNRLEKVREKLRERERVEENKAFELVRKPLRKLISRPFHRLIELFLLISYQTVSSHVKIILAVDRLKYMTSILLLLSFVAIFINLFTYKF